MLTSFTIRNFRTMIGGLVNTTGNKGFFQPIMFNWINKRKISRKDSISVLSIVSVTGLGGAISGRQNQFMEISLLAECKGPFSIRFRPCSLWWNETCKIKEPVCNLSRLPSNESKQDMGYCKAFFAFIISPIAFHFSHRRSLLLSGSLTFSTII